MNANEQAIYDAVTFLLDHRNVMKTVLNETEIERLNRVQRGLASALEASINADPIFKGAFDTKTQTESGYFGTISLESKLSPAWGGGYKSHKEFMKTGISILP